MEDWDAEAEKTQHVVNASSNDVCAGSQPVASSHSLPSQNSLDQLSDSTFAALALQESSTVDEKRPHERYKLVVDENKSKVFVSNIQFKCSQQSLWKALEEKFGKVRHCHLFLDYKGRSKGCATVTFVTEESASAFISASDQFVLFNRTLHVEPAKRKQKISSSGNEGVTVPPAAELTSIESLPIDGERKPDGETVDEVSEPPSQELSCQHNLIFVLNDACMLHIFTFLSLREKITCERVSSALVRCELVNMKGPNGKKNRKWSAISTDSLRQLKRLDFSDASQPMRLITDRIMKKVINQVSPCLRSLCIEIASNAISDQTLNLIVERCTNLEEIFLSGVMSITDSGLKTLANGCKNLKVITLQSNHNTIGENGVWWLFHRCKQLTSVNLDKCATLKGHCFHVMGNEFVTLSMDSCTKVAKTDLTLWRQDANLSDAALDKIALHCEKLRSLNISGCLRLTNKAMDNIAKLRGLVRLSMNGCLTYIAESGLMLIQHLHCLEELHLANNQNLNNDVLLAISQGCRALRVVDISQNSQFSMAGRIGNYGLIALADNCSQLASLNINNLSHVSDDVLFAFARVGRLVSLRAQYCDLFSDSGVCCLLSDCKNLELLDFTGCCHVSNLSLTYAIDQVRQRSPKRNLVLYMTDTSVEVHDWSIIPAEIQLVWAERLFDNHYDNFDDDDYDDDGDDDEDLEFLDDDDFLDNDDVLAAERWNLS